MQNNTLQMKRALRAALLVLLLSVVGMGKGYAINFDFSATCPSGQTLYYKIIDVTNHYVKIACPNSEDYYSSTPYGNYPRPTGDIILPSNVSYNGISYIVTEIGKCAFYHCSELTGLLTIPNSVTSIGDLAFAGCSALTGSLTIPNSVTSIGNSAFSRCSGLTGPLTIPNSVTSIGTYAFYNCGRLSAVYYNAINCTDNPDYTDHPPFEGCSVDGLTIGEEVERIPERMFYYCFYSGTVHFNAIHCEDMNRPLLNSNPYFDRSISIGENVQRIPSFLCMNGNFIGNLILPNSVTSIGNSAFRGCSRFTGSLIIPNSVTSIGDCAFYGCSGFTGNLVIGNSVSVIGVYSFAQIGSTNVIFTGDVSQWCNITFTSNTSNPLMYINNLYIDNNLVTDLIIPETITVIKDNAFCGCSALRH